MVILNLLLSVLGGPVHVIVDWESVIANIGEKNTYAIRGVVLVECSYLDTNTPMDMDFICWILAAFAPLTVITLGVVCFYYYAQEEDDETCEKRWYKWFQKHVDKVKKL